MPTCSQQIGRIDSSNYLTTTGFPGESLTFPASRCGVWPRYLPLDVNEVYLNFSATLPEVLDGKAALVVFDFLFLRFLYHHMEQTIWNKPPLNLLGTGDDWVQLRSIGTPSMWAPFFVKQLSVHLRDPLSEPRMCQFFDFLLKAAGKPALLLILIENMADIIHETSIERNYIMAPSSSPFSLPLPQAL